MTTLLLMNKNLSPSISNRQQLLNASLLLVHFKLKKKKRIPGKTLQTPAVYTSKCKSFHGYRLTEVVL